MKFSDRIKIRMYMESDPSDEYAESEHALEVGREVGRAEIAAFPDLCCNFSDTLRFFQLETEDAACPPPRTQQLRPELVLWIVDEDAWKKACDE